MTEDVARATALPLETKGDSKSQAVGETKKPLSLDDLILETWWKTWSEREQWAPLLDSKYPDKYWVVNILRPTWGFLDEIKEPQIAYNALRNLLRHLKVVNARRRLCPRGPFPPKKTSATIEDFFAFGLSEAAFKMGIRDLTVEGVQDISTEIKKLMIDHADAFDNSTDIRVFCRNETPLRLDMKIYQQAKRLRSTWIALETLENSVRIKFVDAIRFQRARKIREWTSSLEDALFRRQPTFSIKGISYTIPKEWSAKFM